MTPHEWGAEELLADGVQWVKLFVEAGGALVIAIGVGAGALNLVRGVLARRPEVFSETRLVLARYLALALEFQLAADILSTAIAPSWDQIGKLGAIAVIRTGLNYFLSREVREIGHGEPPHATSRA